MHDFEGTPAPWRLVNERTGTLIIAQHGTIIAHLEPTPITGSAAFDGPLIAAAPELLAVLEEIMPDGFTIRDNFDGEGWLKRAQAAIDRAIGVSA